MNALKSKSTPLALAAFALAFIAAAAAAGFANGYYVDVIARMVLAAMVGVGLNVLIGLTGQVSFGHVGFYAIGAYVVAILTTQLHLPFSIAVVLATLAAGAMGALLALPALRVRGPYLAMVTIAFGFIVERGASEWSGLTGGQNGIMDIPSPSMAGTAFGPRGIALVSLVLLAVLVYGYWKLSLSTWGRAMRAVKDSETAAESIGFDPVLIKAAAFTLSALCAGLAGGLFAPLLGMVTPSAFSFSQSILFVLVVVIGGAGSVAGPLVGAAIVVLLPEMVSGMAEYSQLLFGALLLVVLWIAPEGIVGAVRRFVGRRVTLQAPSTETPLPMAARSTAELVVQNLTIAFGGVKAVTALALHAKPGAITSLIGPNGAGKTTALNMLSGFYQPGAGSIRLGGVALEGLRAWRIARAGIARTYQTSQLFGSLSVLDNLIIAEKRGRAGQPFAAAAQPAAVERVLALAAFVGYSGDLLRPAADLAHVDRRLVEIARALATQPAVLLLDEPAAGLSREDKDRLALLLRRIAAQNIAVVIVEHDMALVMGISDEVVVIDAGVRIAAGSPREVQQDAAVKKAYLGEGAGRPGAARAAEADIGEPLLETGRLSAGYGASPVLHEVSLRVREREMVAVLGANGAGKSTLMRALAGLHRPALGQIAFGGRAIETLPAHQVTALGMVLVPEGRQVFAELSVLDNIRLGAFLRKDIDVQQRDAEVEGMLERFPRLRERAQQRAGLLSGGEQQMLAIARGLMAKPKLLLLDEPSLGLAPTIIAELFAALDRLRGERVTILLVDQMAGLALALADRAYVIEGGRIVASGSAAEIAQNDALERAYLGGGE
ncbi:MAG TPA: ATP-binding cassette domain-containing protein [Burkholderiales bacterium]|jgi:ABC-type branched-subunit amino acid transport system ATPase component/ABC-type branched-subunit amino acid transport system permease subunit|nr:ATP-binding cassette domain-containing protein [Burkholderiales bacterium]